MTDLLPSPSSPEAQSLLEALQAIAIQPDESSEYAGHLAFHQVRDLAREAIAAWNRRTPPATPADPLDTPLPCVVEINHIRYGKGVKLRTLVNAARRWHSLLVAQAATPAEAHVEGGGGAAAAWCFICAGADDDEGFDYCRVCGRVGKPLPHGASR
jgi:hypothetical protein